MSNKLTIKKTTPKTIKAYQDLDLFDFNKVLAERAETNIDIYMNEEKLKALWEATFTDEFPDDYENIDLGVVAQGVSDFLAQLRPRLSGSR